MAWPWVENPHSTTVPGGFDRPFERLWHYERESGPALPQSDTFMSHWDTFMPFHGEKRISARFPPEVHCSALTAVKLGLGKTHS